MGRALHTGYNPGGGNLCALLLDLALAKHGVQACRGAGSAGAWGGVALLDLPSFVAAVYFWDERNSMPREEFLDSIYFHSPLGATGSALHSITRSLSFSPLLGA